VTRVLSRPSRQLARRTGDALRVTDHAVFGLIPAIVTAWLPYQPFTRGLGSVDLRNDFWPAGDRVLHGADPYAWTRAQFAAGISFRYPALTAILFAPFGAQIAAIGVVNVRSA
jgi:hypothetical protein